MPSRRLNWFHVAVVVSQSAHSAHTPRVCKPKPVNLFAEPVLCKQNTCIASRTHTHMHMHMAVVFFVWRSAFAHSRRTKRKKKQNRVFLFFVWSPSSSSSYSYFPFFRFFDYFFARFRRRCCCCRRRVRFSDEWVFYLAKHISHLYRLKVCVCLVFSLSVFTDFIRKHILRVLAKAKRYTHNRHVWLCVFSNAIHVRFAADAKIKMCK